MPAKGQYASQTDVSIERSEAELKQTLKRYGCYDISSGEFRGQSFLVAHYAKRMIQINLVMPDRKEFELRANGARQSPKQATLGYEKELRRQWRVMILLLKAKFEAVMARPEIFEWEFLAYLVDPSTNKTIGEQIVPQIGPAYDGDRSNGMLRLPPPGGGNWREVKEA